MKAVLFAFDEFLAKKKLAFSSIVIGGAALIVSGVVDRATEDVDCVIDSIPEEISKAASEFSKVYNGPGSPLNQDWLNNGPKNIRRDLPIDWENNVQLLFNGKSLKLTTLSRINLLKTKLYAFCDRQEDFADCLALKPTLKELKRCFEWVSSRDANELWPDHVTTSFKALAEELGYEFNT